MKRLITTELNAWKSRKNRKPLIVRGARQVGKTYTIEEFGRSNFTHTIKVNFEEQIELKELFIKSKVHQILDELSILYNTEINPGKTLIFLDEIQALPEAIVKLRYFYENYPDLHIIAAGSLLDFVLKSMKYSMPVGRIEFCYMYPLSFKEFLLSLSETRLLDYVDNYLFDGLFSKAIHKKILDYLRLYIFIGGMPEAVRKYIDEKSLPEVERIHSNIMTTLQHDFAKYGSLKQQEYLKTVLRYTVQNIGKKVKYANIDQDTRSINLKEAFHRLEMARIVQGIRHTNANQVPLSTSINDRIYKPIFIDIGLANHFSGIRLIDLDQIFTNNEGGLAEQFIGQELLSMNAPYLDPKLYYWMREEKNANAEIDYIYQHNNSIYPIEVKAGATGSLKSLQVYLFEKKQKTGIRFNLDTPNTGKFKTTVRVGGKSGVLDYQLISLPLYMCNQLPVILDTLQLSINAGS